MRAWVACVLVAGGCYRGAAELPSCTIACASGCPSGMTCSAGYCTTGPSCADAAPCGLVGNACCASAPACTDNSYCDGTGTCQAGCVTDVALGRRHTCVREHDGTVWCAGDDSHHELGTGSAGPPSATFVQVSDGAAPISDATAIGAGWGHTCAVRAGGQVSCWGTNAYGELGASGGPGPLRVVDETGTPLAGMVAVDGGTDFSCALAHDGGVWCWGQDAQGQLGDGALASRPYARPISNVTGATAIALSISHACALDSAGQVWCWGDNASGEIGNGTDGTGAIAATPFQVPLAMPALAIAAGSFHSCALLADHSVQCWGADFQQQLGTDSGGASEKQPAAVVVAAGGAAYTAIAIAAGSVTYAITADHHADSWGDSVHGQAGNGGGSLFPSPISHGDGELANVERLVAHYAHACAVRGDGSVLCWGRNSEGELGDGTFDNRGTPVPIGASCP